MTQIQRWEYLTAPILTHAAKQILDNFGADGWELVQIAPGMNPENLVGYFKRPVGDGTVPSLVFGELTAGRYDLFEKGCPDQVVLTAEVAGGQVATASWPA